MGSTESVWVMARSAGAGFTATPICAQSELPLKVSLIVVVAVVAGSVLPKPVTSVPELLLVEFRFHRWVCPDPPGRLTVRLPPTATVSITASPASDATFNVEPAWFTPVAVATAPNGAAVSTSLKLMAPTTTPVLVAVRPLMVVITGNAPAAGFTRYQSSTRRSLLVGSVAWPNWVSGSPPKVTPPTTAAGELLRLMDTPTTSSRLAPAGVSAGVVTTLIVPGVTLVQRRPAETGAPIAIVACAGGATREVKPARPRTASRLPNRGAWLRL